MAEGEATGGEGAAREEEGERQERKERMERGRESFICANCGLWTVVKAKKGVDK